MITRLPAFDEPGPGPVQPLRPACRAASALSRLGLFALQGRPAPLAARCLLVAVNLASVAFFLLSYLAARRWLRPLPDRPGRLPPRQPGVATTARTSTGRCRRPAAGRGCRSATLRSPRCCSRRCRWCRWRSPRTALTLTTIALIALVLRMFLRSLVGPGAGSWWTIGWLLPAALFLEPVRNTLNYGQVNVALMALVAADCLTAAPRWPRGALVGLAAAVKLTPGRVCAVLPAPAGLARGPGGRGVVRGQHRGRLPARLARLGAVLDLGRLPGRTAGQPGLRRQPVHPGRAGASRARSASPAGAAAWLALSAVVVIAACRGMRPALDRGRATRGRCRSTPSRPCWCRRSRGRITGCGARPRC